MSSPAIRLREVAKMYPLFDSSADRVLSALGLERLAFWKTIDPREFWALRDVSLDIPAGERIGVIGPNGAGKSTLLKIILGNIEPTAGSLEVNGRIQALIELGTGFHPEFTGRENIRASLAYQGFSSQYIRDAEEQVIEFSELEDFIEQPVKTYSQGMYARLGFATATVMDPEILIIDEVLSAGDAYFAGKCVERMRDLTEQTGATVLFVSHDMVAIQKLCTQVVWILRGRVHQVGDPLDVLQSYAAHVRAEEEVRILARDLRIGKREAQAIRDTDQLYWHQLCRFRTESGSGDNKIYGIELRSGDKPMASIDVGGPMDNDLGQRDFLIDNRKLSNWGKSSGGAAGTHRPLVLSEERHSYAPFQLAIPRPYLHENSPLTLSVEASCESSVVVEAHDAVAEGYASVGVLATGAGSPLVTELTLPPIEVQQSAGGAGGGGAKEDGASHALHSVDRYGSGGITIERVRLFTGEPREETRVLFVREPFRVAIDYKARRPIDNPFFALAVYLPNGQCATHWFADATEAGRGRIEPGEGSFLFEGDALPLGRGSYVASAGIYKGALKLDGVEPAPYDVRDRSVHFIVEPRDALDRRERGICVHTVESRFA